MYVPRMLVSQMGIVIYIQQSDNFIVVYDRV